MFNPGDPTMQFQGVHPLFEEVLSLAGLDKSRLCLARNGRDQAQAVMGGKE